MKIETRAIHAGNIKSKESGAVVQPITLSTTFERNENGDYNSGYMYSRTNNPNRQALENVLSALECGADAAAFSSGNAAGMAVFQALEKGTHVLCPDDMYHGLRNQLKLLFKNILSFDFIDLSDVENVASSIKTNTQLIWIETPSNPLLKLCDIEKISALAKTKNILVVADNTFASPICQQPLLLGADMVMHSSTKYLSGHSDVTGGILISKAKDAFWQKIKTIQVYGGAVPSPFDCYLLCRSIKTLPYRMKGHGENAQQVAEFLSQQERVEEVYYPGLSHHPQFELAKQQMKNFGGMLSFLVKGGEDAARKFINSLKLFTQATSLGGLESLIEHRYSVEGADSKTPKNLIRVSVGLENIDDLIYDLAQALSF